MNGWRTALWATAFLFCGLSVARPADDQKNDPEVLLEAARHKALVDGDLEAAIEICEKIVAEHNGDRATAAQALVHIGRCYEKLGKTEARKAYERVVREYADQPEAVSAARARLTALGRQRDEEGPTLRRVYSGYIGYPCNLSHDGKLAAIIDWDTGDLAVRDLTSSGVGPNSGVRRLTNEGSWSESSAFADQSIFSPDDRQIAYCWYTHEGGVQLRIISADGTGQRVLYPRNEEDKKHGAFLLPIDWSLDGERILCTWHKEGHKNRVMLLSVRDGSLRELELPEREEGKPISDFSSAKFSPDGRYLTIDSRPVKDAGRDILLLSLEDGSRTPLVEDPADDYLLGWSPDGNYLVFASDRTGDRGIWVLRVDQGKPVGNPKLVKTQMGNFRRVGMMRDGAYCFRTNSGERRNVFTAGLDPETGKVTTVSKALLPDAELARSMADWLPGAEEIAYLEWGDEEGIKIRKIMVHSLKTGATREVVTKPKIKNYNINSLAVCPTGRWLAVCGYVEDPLKWRVLLIDLETNELTEVKQPGAFVNIRWSKDGRWLYFSGFLPDENRIALFRRDMQTGEVTELFKPPSSFYSWRISPDEKQIAYTDWETDEIKVIPVTGGEPRVVAKVKSAGTGGLKFWTPDGRYLVYVQLGQLWRVAVEGGEPEAISRGMPPFRCVQIHPDGQRILFCGRRHVSKLELWALENFLPERKAASIWQDRAKASAILGRWEEAARDFADVVKRAPQDEYAWCALAALWLHAGEEEAYKRGCQEAFLRLADGDKWRKAGLVQMCSLAPDCGIDRSKLTPLADSALSESDHIKIHLAKGMDAYRCGRFEEALAHLPREGNALDAPLTNFFQAMAHYRLGDTAQAHWHLRRGIGVIERRVPSIDGPPLADWLPDRWIVWCIVDVVRREAEATIGANTGDHRRDRAKASAILGRWEEAARDFVDVVKRAPQDERAWCALAALWLHAGEEEAYKRACQEAFLRLADGDRWHKARLVQMCSLAPDCGIDRSKLTPLADSALSESDNNKMYLAKGMDAYRCGRFEEALAHLPEKGDALCEPLSYFFQAMARYRLGDTEQARELLGRGIEAMEQKVPTIDGPPLGDWLPDRWIVWCIVHAVRREAEETIGAITGDQRSQAPANVKPESEY